MKIYIDEAGRGPFAGPLHIGIVLPLKKFQKKIFKDSKKLSEKQREFLFQKINYLEIKGSLIYGIGIVNNKEIDLWGLTKSTNIAIKRGVFELLKKFYNNYLKEVLSKGLCSCDIINRISIENILIEKFSIENLKNIIQIISQTNPVLEIIIDGNCDFSIQNDLGTKVSTIIKGDDKIPEISIASIIAKVTRDQRMIDIANKQHPKYNFKKHKGYGTKEHIKNIKKYGLCEIHRKLFWKNKKGYIYGNHLGLYTKYENKFN